MKRIGLTVRRENEGFFVRERYLQYFKDYELVILTPYNIDYACDAYVILGGNDANPKLYSEENISILKTVVNDFSVTNHRDWLYHKEYMLCDSNVFSGLGSKILELARFQKEFPHTAIKTDLTPDYVISPAFLTGFYGVKTGYELNYGLLGFNYGKGKIIFNAFNILNNLSNCDGDNSRIFSLNSCSFACGML